MSWVFLCMSVTCHNKSFHFCLNFEFVVSWRNSQKGKEQILRTLSSLLLVPVSNILVVKPSVLHWILNLLKALCNHCGLFTIYLLETLVLEVWVERRIGNSETALAVLCVGSRGCWRSGEKKRKQSWKNVCELQVLLCSRYSVFPDFHISHT